MSMAKSEPKSESGVVLTGEIIEDTQTEFAENTELGADNAEENEDPNESKKLQYDRRFMLDLSKNTACQKRPRCLSADHLNGNGIWDPEKWFREKHNSSPAFSEEGQPNKRPSEYDAREPKKRITDPKERIKEEMQDDIVLSPQRRSFGTGCHVINQRRLSSPVDLHDSGSKDTVLPSRDSTSRRIGSGRLSNRSNSERQENDRDYGYRSSHRDFGSRFREKDHDRPRRGRMSERASSQEPEWYSDGPVSQSEFIELRGFEDPNKDDERKAPPRNSPINVKKTSTPNADCKWGDSNLPGKGTLHQSEKNGSLETNESSSPSNSDPPQNVQPNDFDVNEFFKMDHFAGFPMMMPTDTIHGSSHSPENDLGGSRFSRWRHGVPNSQNFIPVPTDQDAQNVDVISSLFDEPEQRNLGTSPSPPISFNQNQKNILEILQSANINVGPQQLSDLSANNAQLKRQAMEGKAKSVEELEAGLRQLVLGKENGTNAETDALRKYLRDSGRQTQKETLNLSEENSAFNKLINSFHENGQPFSQHPVPPIDKSQAMSEKQLLQDMLSDEARLSKNQNHTKNPTTEQDILNNMLNQGSQQSNAIARMVKQQELLRRISPVPSDVLSAMRHPGSFPAGLGSDQPVVQPQNQSGIQQREMLMSLLKQQQQQLQHQTTPGIHQQTVSPNLGHQLLMPPLGHISPVNHSPLLQDGYPQQQRVPSPLVFGQQPPMISHAPSPIHPTQGLQGITPQNTLQVQGSPTVPRVLSPQQLVARTQAIYHNALIQKKVEEQQGNFRRKQEYQQRSFSPSNVQQNGAQKPDHVQAKVTMATFTPTSVMRRMHSESKTEMKSNGSCSNEPELQSSHGGTSPARSVHARPLHGQGVMNSQGMTTVGKMPASSGHGQVSPPRPIVKANNSSTSTPFVNRQSVNETPPQLGGRSIHGFDNNPDLTLKAADQQGMKMQQINQASMFRARLPSGGQLPPNMSTSVPPPSLIVAHGPQTNIPLHLQQHQQQQQQMFRNFYSPQKPQAIRGQSNMISSNQSSGQHNLPFAPAVYNPHKMPPQPLPNAQSIQQILQNQRFGQANAAMMNDGFNGNTLKQFQTRPNSAVLSSNPANLSKWFGTEILKRNMPTMPPVPTQKALSLEEVERQHQVAG